MHQIIPRRRRAGACLPLTIMLILAGCAEERDIFPVSGRVEWEDGTPLTTGGSVFFDAVDETGTGERKANARGAILEDGTFVMGTFEEADGAYPGKHRVLVKAMRDPKRTFPGSIVPLPVIDDRFESYETSGIEVDVTEGDNEFVIQVARPKTK